MRSIFQSIILVFFVFIVGCDGENLGGEGEKCYPEGTCDVGYYCDIEKNRCLKDVFHCNQLGDIKCGLTPQEEHAIMICGIVEATKEKEWVVKEKCSVTNCCYNNSCVSISDGVTYGANNCELGRDGDRCENNEDCDQEDYYCKDQACKYLGTEGDECTKSSECYGEYYCDEENQCHWKGSTGDVCAGDYQCEDGLACRQLHCQKRFCSIKSECTLTSVCNEYDCIEGVCVAEPLEDGTDCTAEDICHVGQCQAGKCAQVEIEKCCYEVGEIYCKMDSYEESGQSFSYTCGSDNRLDSGPSCYYPEKCDDSSGDCKLFDGTSFCNYLDVIEIVDGKQEIWTSSEECHEYCITDNGYESHTCLEDYSDDDACCCCYDGSKPDSCDECNLTY